MGVAPTHMGLGRYAAWLSLALGLVVLDLWTKQLASTELDLYRAQPITSWLNLTLAHNSGAAFSFLADAGGWQRWFLSGAAVVIMAILLVWLKRLPQKARLLPAAIALVLSGALGNLIDRVRWGYVVDFIDVHVAGYHWPAFNVADSAIVVGVVLILIEGFVPQSKGPGSSPNTP
ncbi:MAG TPA: signal peptidase II [Wenzhouxiangella sp.]